MKYDRAKLWLRVIGSLCIILAIAGFFIQWFTTIDQVRDQIRAKVTEDLIHSYHMIKIVSYINILFIFVNGLLLLKLSPIGSYFLLISSVCSLLICALPFFFFLAPGAFPIPAILSFDLEEISGYAILGIVPFVASFIPFWGPPLSFLCYRSLNAESNLHKNHKRDKDIFNTDIGA